MSQKYICEQRSNECGTCQHAVPHNLITTGYNKCADSCPFASGPCIKVSALKMTIEPKSTKSVEPDLSEMIEECVEAVSEGEQKKEDNKSIWDTIDSLSKKIPDSEWDKLPRNASEIVGNEDNYIAYCPECGDGMRTDWKQKNNEYYCIGCDKKYKLVET